MSDALQPTHPQPQTTPTQPTTAAAPAPEPTPTVQIQPTDATPALTTAVATEPPAPTPATAPVPAPDTAEMPAATPAPTAKAPAEPVTATKEEVPEPQNTLTKRFTDAEWKALKEFRAALPAIFAEAFPDNEAAKDTPIIMWGVTIDPVNPYDAKVSVVLIKFLRARNLSITEARDMLINTLRWRESFDIKAALEERFPEDIFGQLGKVFGRDKENHPVVYNLYGANKDLKAVFGDVQRFIRWRVALMERSIELLDFTEIDQTVQVHDYEGVSLTSRDANSKAAAAEATNIFQSHYPELLYKKFFINVPTLLNWIFWLFKPVISANTLAKMSVVGTGTHAINKALSPFVDSKELPERYGGTAKGFEPKGVEDKAKA